MTPSSEQSSEQSPEQSVEQSPDQSPEQSGIEIRVEAERTSATVLIDADLFAEALTLEILTGLAREHEIDLNDAVESRLKDIIEHYLADPVAVETVFAESTAPVDGKDAYLQWQDEYDPNASRNEDANARVDFYSRVNYVAVKCGTHIATVYRATDGEDGVDVTGQIIASKPGAALSMEIDEESVQVDESGRALSKVDGILEANDERLAVSRTLAVPEYVDFSTGNINFDGSIHVGSGVRDRFVVEATETIVIDGLIEAATIVAGGNFVARQGMAAKDSGQLTVAGDAEIGYINNVRGRVEGNLVVRREIVNCDLFVGGDLTCEQATILGGETAVIGTLTVGTVGSNAMLPTTLVLGMPIKASPELVEIEHQIQETTAQIQMFQEKLAAITCNSDLTHQEKEQLTELSFELDEAEQKLKNSNEARTAILVEMHKAIQIQAVVKNRIHAEVRLQIGIRLMRFKDGLKGPVTIRSSDDGEVRICTADGEVHPLTDYAREIEQAA